LREHYASLGDDELLGIERSELTSMAQECFDVELQKRNLQFGAAAEVDDDEVEFDVADPAHEPDWMATAFPASVYTATPSGALDAAAARDALLAAGIPCEVTEHEIESEDEPAPPAINREYRVMVPGASILQATSVLDVAIFNGRLEDEWKTQLASLSDEELNALDVESRCAGLLDRVARRRTAFKDEIRSRRS
jgi:hypothetical protein